VARERAGRERGIRAERMKGGAETLPDFLRDFVEFDDGDAGGVGDAADLHGVVAHGDVGGDGGVARRRADVGEGAEGGEGRGE